MCIHLIKLEDKKMKEIYKIKRTSKQYVGLIDDVLEDYNEIYKDYSDLVGIYLNEKIIGLVVLTNKPLNGKYSFTDFIIDEDYQHKGYGKQVTNKIIDYFKNMDESKIIKIEVFSENTIAIKCYEKCGFRITKKCNWNNNFLEMEIDIN